MKLRAEALLLNLRILFKRCSKCKVEKVSKYVFKITLTQGLNRQIRRMCAHLSYKVTKLKRERIMNVNLGDIPIGKWRNLTKDELDTIFNLIANSDKTEDASC